MVQLLASKDPGLADAAARILTQEPSNLDAAVFISTFDQQSPRTKRLYCAILSRLPQQTEETRKFFVHALHDQEDGVRWQAAVTIAQIKWNDAQSQSALLDTMNDKNEIVGAAAVCTLAKLGATNAGPALFSKLKSRLQVNISPEEIERQATLVIRDLHSDFNRGPDYKLLDPDDLEMLIYHRAPGGLKKQASMRLPPSTIPFPTHDYSLVDALLQALGDLRFGAAADELFKLQGTDYYAEATCALNKVAPERLTKELLTIAKDTQTDSYLRERAMVSLCNLSVTNSVQELVPLLEDSTPIVYSRKLPGPEWRICDRAAASMAILLGWEDRLMPRYVPPRQREELLARAREWAKANP